MAALFEKFTYDAPARSGWHIRKNLLERTGYDNQSILFFDFGRLTCSAGGEIPLDHNIHYPYWTMLFILDGEAAAFCNQEQFTLEKNDVFMVAPPDRIRVRVAPRGRLEVCQLSILDSPASRVQLSGLCQERVLHLKNPDIILPVLRNIENLLRENLVRADQAVLCDLAVLIFSLIAKILLQCPDSESTLTIAQIGFEISCSPWNNYSLPELAAKCGLSPRSFERQFCKIFGCSWLQYLTGAKIGMACTLLQTTRYPVDEIVSLCNFRSKPYFYQAFKKQTGATPLAFRDSRHIKRNMFGFLLRRIDTEKSLTANRKKILWLLLQDPRNTVSEIAGKIAIHRSAVQKNLEWLKNNHYIRRQGSRRAGYWLILKSDIPKPD